VRREKRTTYTTEDGLIDNNINDIAVDKDGNIWIAAGIAWSPGEEYKAEVSKFDGTKQNFSLSINNVPLGEATTSLFGVLHLSLDTQNAADGHYILTLDDLPGPSASFQLDTAADTLPRQGDYELSNLPEVPVYTRRSFIPLSRK